MGSAFFKIVMGAAVLALGESLALADGPKSPKDSSKVVASPTQKVHEERFVSIGGMEQWVTIKGESRANPVVLFIHGGPGNTMSPYADQIYGAWEKDFTMVQWDQRGAGRTYGRNMAADRIPEDEDHLARYLIRHPLTLERMTEDGVELAKYLTQRLGQKKIILMGGSWGSILGVHMVKSMPELFHAYVGISQIVSPANEAASYAKVIAMARAAGDLGTVSKLEALGTPPWVNPRNFGVLRRATRVYEAKTSTPAPKSWWVRSPHYDTPQMRADYSEGEEYSFAQFVGLKGDGMSSKVDFNKPGKDFKVPVFLIHGSEDLVAVPDVAKHYFDTLVAPRKEFVLVPATGHDLNLALIDAQYNIIKKRVVPLVN